MAESPAPVRVAALAEYLGFNHNAVRQHLAKLTDAGLLTEERASPTTTGRPPLQYRVTPTAMGSWGGSGSGGRTRTADPSIMSRVLLPTELRRQVCFFDADS